jgi:hypothetical protein
MKATRPVARLFLLMSAGVPQLMVARCYWQKQNGVHRTLVTGYEWTQGQQETRPSYLLRCSACAIIIFNVAQLTRLVFVCHRVLLTCFCFNRRRARCCCRRPFTLTASWKAWLGTACSKQMCHLLSTGYALCAPRSFFALCSQSWLYTLRAPWGRLWQYVTSTILVLCLLECTSLLLRRV